MPEVLYERNREYIPRIAAVHDMCGYGKCSLTAAIPILSAAGCDVCPVPTALFSAHTRYKVFTMEDTTDMLGGYLDAWQQEGVELDGVYSGFLGSPDQVAIIQRLYREYPKSLRFVDPVMGDAGEMYATYTAQLCEAMGALVDGADLLMPQIIGNLFDMGAKNVVLKGIDHNDGRIRNFVANAKEGVDRMTECVHEKLPYMCHGTGDAFASAMIGGVMAGLDLAAASRLAGEFVHNAMVQTKFQPDYQDRGVSFELSLGDLTSLVD